ncbi:hypothetical protein IFM89_026074 [Coptis chinensis]|uniref:Uncharacterized protein n=1 Tax=Coptis chinensis TaxID=261450 RepID=A0A835IFM6_9MAGN|nr:hypothetical protein IFM89_026074 [Coptis chinensis]
MVVASGIDERTLKCDGVCVASLPTTMGYNALKDFFTIMSMKPNPQCSNFACFERQKEYAAAKPARDAAAKAKMESKTSSATECAVHLDNEWNISVVDDNEVESTDVQGSSDALPVGLVRELPSADEIQKPLVGETSTSVDDLEELWRQLDALNVD